MQLSRVLCSLRLLWFGTIFVSGMMAWANAPATPQAGPTPATNTQPATATPVGNPLPATADAPPAAPMVTNVFADTDIRQALSDISAQTTVPIVADNTVQGTVSGDFKNAPLPIVLKVLLQSGGYAYTKINDYYLVGAPDPSNPNYPLLCTTEVVKLNYVPAAKMAQMLSQSYGRYLTPEDGTTSRNQPGLRGSSQTLRSAIADSNIPSTMPGYQLIINAPTSLIERIRADIAALDQPRQQVMIEASVVEISQEGLKRLGVDWATHWLRFNMSDDGPNLVYSQVANTEMVAIDALVENGKARLRANPRVATVEDALAELEVGKENYFQIVSGSLTYPVANLEKITSGILLRVSAHVLTPSREILLTVEPEVRDVTGKGVNGLPEITFRRASTTLRVPNGQSIVIGGLLTETSTRIVRKFPVLSEIPFLGPLLFYRSVDEKRTSEVVIIITPHIVDDNATLATGTLNPAIKQEVAQPQPESKISKTRKK